jgi:uncharacterized membrane protein
MLTLHAALWANVFTFIMALALVAVASWRNGWTYGLAAYVAMLAALCYLLTASLAEPEQVKWLLICMGLMVLVGIGAVSLWIRHHYFEKRTSRG